jgi:hypothetical protein
MCGIAGIVGMSPQAAAPLRAELEQMIARRRRISACIADGSSVCARGLRPVIATVVPPARSQGWWQGAKDFVKQRVLRRPSRFEQVVAFNDWLRALGAELAVPVLDLELLLRVSAEDRHMRPEYDAGDSIHLASVAYQRLDKDLLEFLDRLEWPRTSR